MCWWFCFLLLLPHFGHGQELEVGLGALVLREDVVEVFLPAGVHLRVVALDLATLLDAFGHQVSDLALEKK